MRPLKRRTHKPPTADAPKGVPPRRIYALCDDSCDPKCPVCDGKFRRAE